MWSVEGFGRNVTFPPQAGIHDHAWSLTKRNAKRYLEQGSNLAVLTKKIVADFAKGRDVPPTVWMMLAECHHPGRFSTSCRIMVGPDGVRFEDAG
jgi:hypothetical protein